MRPPVRGFGPQQPRGAADPSATRPAFMNNSGSEPNSPDFYALFAYGLTTLYWAFVKDYMYFFRADLGPYRGKRHPSSAWVALFGGKAWHYTSMIVLPLLVLDVAWWQFAIGLLTVHVVGGFILGIVFQLAHVVEETDQLPSGDAVKSKSEWLEYQLRTTNDFAPDNRLLTLYVG